MGFLVFWKRSVPYALSTMMYWILQTSLLCTDVIDTFCPFLLQVMQTIVERYKHIHWQTSPASWDLRLSRFHSERPRSTQSITSYVAAGQSGVGSRHNSVSRTMNDAYSPTLNTNTAAAPPYTRGPTIERVPSLKKSYSVETMPFVRGASSLRSLPPYSRKSFNEPQDGQVSTRPITGPHR